MNCQQTLISDQQIKNFFNRSQITSETLQNNLSLYFTRIEQNLLVITKIHAEILCQKEQVDPTFDATIIEAQRTYDNIIQDQLIKTIESAKSLHDVTGAFGFVIGLLNDTVHSMMKSAQIEEKISSYLAKQEEDAPLIKKEALEKCANEIQTHELQMDAIFNTTLHEIAILAVEHSSKEIANHIIQAVHYNSLKFSDIIKKTIHEAIQNIEECINKLPLAIDNALPQKLMGNHLTRGTKSASAQTMNPIASLKTTISHAFRKKKAREAYRQSLLIRLASGPQHKSSLLEIKCLTAVAKRYANADFDAKNRGYLQLMKHLQTTINLIHKKNRSLCENVHLLSPLLFCQVDKKAFKNPRLNQQLPIQHRFFSRSPYQDNKHFVVRDTLKSLWSLANSSTDDSQKNDYLNTLRMNCLSIINFYIQHLMQEFLAHPIFAPWVRQSNAEGQKELLNLIIQLINNELMDNTPSDYYSAPLCGVSLFCSALDKQGSLQLELSNEGGATLNFTGSLSPNTEVLKQNIEPLLLLDKITQIDPQGPVTIDYV